MKFSEYKDFNLSNVAKKVLQQWKEEQTFQESLKTREGKAEFVFYDGPPSANGMPGIHHVISRSLKDIVCRYKTLQGFHVERKAGWDTHGLPVELGVEKALGITKDDIGQSISIEDYNKACRKSVMKYTDSWEDLTEQMGYWADMDNPYITYDNKYIETLWWLLKQLFDKGYLYKGFSIQPYSPTDGTGLSSHELNLPGCYKDVKDTTIVAQFKIVRDETSERLFADVTTDLHFIAWTTTPWTLPSNTALAVGPKINYVKIRTFNPYTGEPVTIICAEDLYPNFFKKEEADLPLDSYEKGGKTLPYEILERFQGAALDGIRYEQLMPYQQPEKGDAFRVILGDFVTTEDGTGVVHIAPSFGADDYRIAQQNDIGALTLVSKQGKFIEGTGDLEGRYVKNDYDDTLTDKDETTDVYIAVKLKNEGKAFKIEKYVHSYPHSWRTDKPILYYPLDSWFIKTTAAKERMLALNKTINWKPQSTGEGRFGKWLENLVDWNLSRSRYWGTPLPIWVSEDGQEMKCIGSVAELKAEIEKAVAAGFMSENPLQNFEEGNMSKANYESFDLHRPYVDAIVLVSESGKPMQRESDLIDVWFDSGAMPYAQQHYPFENKANFGNCFPADFIAEGVDQTRGWFFTLHAISTMLFDSVAFKNIISNGLVLDAKGNKMSKRLGNGVDPFETLEKYGADPVRWYMITNAQPWDNLKFDLTGIDEVRRKFFGTLYNTYSFFTLYANVDGFEDKDKKIPYAERPELDRWILSLLNSLIVEVTEHLDNYELTRAGRAIQEFVTENLSNWYVRLCRKRYWGGEYDADKISAYQTLHECLKTISVLASPIAPFYTDQLFRDLTKVQGKEESVHLTTFPKANAKCIDKELEARMDLAQKISSMILGLRRKVKIKVRQPLQKVLIPILDTQMQQRIQAVEDIILTEVNIKEIEYLSESTDVLVKSIKPNFKTLGPKYGKMMKQIAAAIGKLEQEDIADFEKQGTFNLQLESEHLSLTLEDVEIASQDIPGWLVANEGALTVALDITITETLRNEGIARELVNRIQNIRKDSGFEVTDKVNIRISAHPATDKAVIAHEYFIASQTLGNDVALVANLTEGREEEIEEDVVLRVSVEKV